MKCEINSNHSSWYHDRNNSFNACFILEKLNCFCFQSIIEFMNIQLSLGLPQSRSITTSMDTENYRQVPYRFFTNDSNTDLNKLEQLTNLFPDKKATIELGRIEFLCNALKE